jgi:hypothetical protein
MSAATARLGGSPVRITARVISEDSERRRLGRASNVEEDDVM